jgi:predicted extracellular nuclease
LSAKNEELKMRTKMIPRLLTLIFFLSLCISLSGQSNFRVMFYNVENLFDTIDDPNKNDEEFLPDGVRHWTVGRYRNKLNNLAKVITSAGEWDVPALVGMCEVENEQVLKDLTQYSPLKKANYRFVITESSDTRGIDVALLYQRDKFKQLGHDFYRIRFPYNNRKKTRDILHVTGQVLSKDTVDVFVCHFPSRRGGENESEPDRVYVASVLKSKTDSLMKIRKNAHIIIMGDFNDEPSNKSIAQTLHARPISKSIDRTSLYNLFGNFEKQKNKGSYKYGNQWNMLDQIIVSGNLIEGHRAIRVQPQTATIFLRDFMVTTDKSHGGKRPKKTFHGYKHEGGYSDHFPVFVDFTID